MSEYRAALQALLQAIGPHLHPQMRFQTQVLRFYIPYRIWKRKFSPFCNMKGLEKVTTTTQILVLMWALYFTKSDYLTQKRTQRIFGNLLNLFLMILTEVYCRNASETLLQRGLVRVIGDTHYACV